jgi:hypothetical protein
VLLAETGTETADFSNVNNPLRLVDTTDSVGVLLVAPGDTVTATYTDADDGAGNENSVIATAVVDCAPPLIRNVQTLSVEAHSATVTFDTDESTSGQVRYGPTCGNLRETAAGRGYNTAHSINLANLTESTTYFYEVEALDEAGNSSTADNGGSCYPFDTADIPDIFTELFASDNDLDNLTLTFTPDGSADFYSGCGRSITALPIDPSGGTTLSLSDDSFAAVILSSGKTVSLYGTVYDTFYVGSNGYVTFTAGDNMYIDSLVNHFDLPRISPLFEDLNPDNGGTISWKQRPDRVVVTWENVPEYLNFGSNTFQIEMHFNGTIVMSYSTLSASKGLAGLSEGNGLPSDFYESDLSAMEACTCEKNADCNDGVFCNGEEICESGTCQPGDNPCLEYCDEVYDGCFSCNNNFTCEVGENCNTCPNDCISGEEEICGNDVCEPSNGEDCLSCPEDCAGKQNGKPSRQFCCGDGVGVNPVDCDDDRCNSEGFACASNAGAYCCGDYTCEGEEDNLNSDVDCVQPPHCGDGF